ncbi:MAG: GGDEF domain-containing protein [Hylemonella sp.]|nr:GGDEF domain-containing protein [Hylemonella sp.]
MPCVTSSTAALIDLHELHLDNARALLQHDGIFGSIASDASPLVYLQAVIDGLCGLSLTDPLTGLANRRHFRTALERQIDSVARHGTSTLLLLLDIDHFKKINDSHGHPAGDLVLQAVARTLRDSIRPGDMAARYGGEEFAIIMSHCQPDHAQAVGERIREAIAALSVPIDTQQHLKVTVSIGGVFAPHWVRTTVDLWTEQADMLLYQAKAQGRNRVCINESEPISVSAEEKQLLFSTSTANAPVWLGNATTDANGHTPPRTHP